MLYQPQLRATCISKDVFGMCRACFVILLAVYQQNRQLNAAHCTGRIRFPERNLMRQESIQQRLLHYDCSEPSWSMAVSGDSFSGNRFERRERTFGYDRIEVGSAAKRVEQDGSA
jgi:hypothetical protein